MAGKSTSQSYLFSTALNKNDAMNKLIKELLTKGQDVSQENIEEQLMLINKKIKNTLKTKVMKYYESGRIVLKYSEEAKMPSAMPFFLIQTSTGIIAIISLATFSNKLQNGDLTIDYKKLYTLLETAYIGILYNQSAKIFSVNSVVMHKASVMYANMVYGAINRKFNIGIDRRKSDMIMFFASKFFLINVLAKDLNSIEIINNIAKSNCKTITPIELSDIDDDFPLQAYRDINVFIDQLSKTCVIHNLNTRSFLSAYMQMFGESTLLGLELFQYFMFNIVSAINGAFLNNQYMFESIIEKDGPKLYNAFN